MVEVPEDEILFSSPVAHEICSQMTQGEKKTRRRRKKAKADGAKKQRLSDEQAKFLEMSFAKEKKLESGRKIHLAAELGLDPKQVAVWFQNRRARNKSKQVEEAYVKLKSIHDTTVVEKCHLENEVMKLKEELLRAEEEIRKFSLGANGGALASNSEQRVSTSSSSFSMATHQPLMEGFGMEEEDNFVYIDEYTYNSYAMEWPNFFGI